MTETITLRDALEEFLAQKEPECTLSTMRLYRYQLERFIEWCEMSSLTLRELRTPHLRMFIAWLAQYHEQQFGKAMKPASISAYSRALKIFLKWCAENDDYPTGVVNNLHKKVPTPKQEEEDITPLSDDEVCRLLAYLKQEDNPTLRLRNIAVVRLLLDTGLRAAEVCVSSERVGDRDKEPTGLLLSGVFLDVGDSYVVVIGKGRKSREVGPLSADTRSALRAYLRRRQPRDRNEQAVFLGRTNEAMTSKALYMQLRKAAIDLNIPHLHPHTLRHTFAVNFLRDGGDIYKLRRLLGHSSIVMTERYLRGFKDKDARSGRAVGERFRG